LEPVALMVILHIALLSALGVGALAIVGKGVKPPTAMFFGFVIVAMYVEGWGILRLLERFLNRAKHQDH
jgi:hypothetical protein